LSFLELEVAMAEDKVLIIMTSGPDTPRRCATPFFFATLATAMDYEVTMFLLSMGRFSSKKDWLRLFIPKPVVNRRPNSDRKRSRPASK